ncbi:MAG: PAS domain S-box protein [Rhodoferax sp.]|nr:PAS domain S-box protein [Rhodoferax sp.]MDP3655307.1 PAS domain S-box protein [Rhodoferax sp.]
MAVHSPTVGLGEADAHRASEQALEEANLRLQTIFDYNPDVMMISRFADGQITDVNQACVRMFGYAREELIGRTTLDLGIWVRLQDRQAMVEPLLTHGYCENVESEFRLKDGSTCVASLTAVIVPLQGVSHIISTLRDITARKQAEDRLQASEALLRTTMESIDEGVLLVSQSGAVLGFNQRFVTLWRVPQEIVQVRQDGALLAHVLDQLLEPEEFAAAVQSLYHSQDEARDTLRFKDGRVFARYTRALLVRDQPGRIWCFKDITQREQTEAKLVESRALLKTLTHAIPDLVWLKDPNGVYLACNQRFEQFFGAEEKDIVGKTDYDFVEPELADFFRKHDQLAMSLGKASVNEEWVGFASDGHRELLETTKTAIFDGENRLIGVLGIGHDITDRKRAENELRLSASVFHHAREAIMITDPQGGIVDVNEAFTRITGYGRAEVLGLNPRILNSGHQRQEFFARMWRDLNAQGYWYGEVWNRRKSGEVFAVMQTISAVKDAHGHLQHYVALFSDITAIKENEKKLEHIAHYDALTSLPNRVLLADRLQQALARSQRREHLLAVAYLDLDGFKAINDHYGHDAGDHLLAALAARMRLALREGDTLARWGGDEFVAVLLDLVDASSTQPLLLRLLAAAAHPVAFGPHTLQVSASLGVTFFPQAREADSEQLLRQADQAMYRAKVAGKNCYCVFAAA